MDLPQTETKTTPHGGLNGRPRFFPRNQRAQRFSTPTSSPAPLLSLSVAGGSTSRRT